MREVLDEFTVDLVLTSGNSVVASIEERIRLVTQEKPRWMPARLWHRILQRVVMIERGPSNV